MSLCLMGLCGVFIFLINYSQPLPPTSTPEAAQIPMEQIIAMTGNAARMQTQVLYTPTMTVSPTRVIVATQYFYYTNTPFIYIPPSHATSTSPAISSPPASYPPDTTGLCVDGTYTYATRKRNACSQHGGVSIWWGH
jgi:hypothetical protein